MKNTGITGVDELLGLLEDALTDCDKQQIQSIVDSAVNRKVKNLSKLMDSYPENSDGHIHYDNIISYLIDSANATSDLLWPAKSMWNFNAYDDRDEP